MVAEMDRLTTELARARWFQERYFETKMVLARIEERQRRSTYGEILGTACLTAGSIGIGASKAFIDVTGYGWIILILCLLLTVAGLFARVWR